MRYNVESCTYQGFLQQSHYDTNFKKSVIKLKQSRMSVCWALLHLPFGVGNTNSTSFNITETNFFGVSRQSLVLSGYNMLSSIPSKLNSILDKLINEEGEIVVLLQLQWLLQQRRQAGINACAPLTCEECTHRETCVEANVWAQVQVQVRQSLRFFLTVTLRLGEEKLRIHADGLQHWQRMHNRRVLRRRRLLSCLTKGTTWRRKINECHKMSKESSTQRKLCSEKC